MTCTHFYDCDRPASWDDLLHAGEWFQRFPSLDCGVKRELVRLLQDAERAGVTIQAVDIRVVVADWLEDRTSEGSDEVLAVSAYRLEGDLYVAVSSQVMLALEPRHADNLVLRQLEALH